MPYYASMSASAAPRWRRACLAMLLVLLGMPGMGYPSARAASAKVIKVLPHHLDLDGHHSLSPSLYERDAYQAHLRKRPELCSGLRFDVQWKAKAARGAALKLRLELLTAKTTKDRPAVLELPVTAKSGWSRWSSLTLAGEQFRQTGPITAWRATLWEGERLLAEQRSFLW